MLILIIYVFNLLSIPFSKLLHLFRPLATSPVFPQLAYLSELLNCYLPYMFTLIITVSYMTCLFIYPQ